MSYFIPGWTMVFKFIKNVSFPLVGELWNSNSTTNNMENVTSALDTTATHNGLYKNRIVNNWQKFSPKEVNVLKKISPSEFNRPIELNVTKL